MPELESKWKPSRDIKTHKGDFMPADLVFFIPPPEYIVNIFSASSNVQNGKSIKPIGRYRRLLFGIFIGLTGGVTLGGKLGRTFQNEALIWIAPLIIVPIIVLYILSSEFNISPTCNYVGGNGVANYILEEEPSPQRGIGLFLFQQAEKLKVANVEYFLNGAYQSTTYRFEWRNVNDEIVFVIEGRHRSREGFPPAFDLYYFALAAERAWSLFAFDFIHQELKQSGKVIFTIGYSGAIVIGLDYVELEKNGQFFHLYKNQIMGIEISEGIIQIIPKENKLSRIWRIKYSDIANARIFMLFFDMLINNN